jgi:hypothetical protein
MRRKLYSIPTSAALILLAFVSGAYAQAIDVKLGHSELVRTDQLVETIIVGNDQVANAAIATAGTIVVTGHALGTTNLILLDEAGAEISSAVVRVVPVDPRPQRTVRLISGGADETTRVYVCGPEPGCGASDGVAGGEALATGAVEADAIDGEAQPEATP